MPNMLTDVVLTMILYMMDVNAIMFFTSLDAVGRCYCQGCDGYITL